MISSVKGRFLLEYKELVVGSFYYKIFDIEV